MRLALTIRPVICTLALAHFTMAYQAFTEYDMKAAYLLNVLKFSEKKKKPGPVVPQFLTLCLLAPGPIEQPLAALANSLVRGRKLRVRPIAPEGGLEGCEVVFIGRSSGHRPMLEKAKAVGALTIGNDTDFVPMSGMIALITENRHIVIEINQNAVRGREWMISSQLLELARIIGGSQ